MKKSLQDALKQAEKVSREYPDKIMAVLDRFGGKATFTVFGCTVYCKRMADGYFLVARYKNGEKMPDSM